MRERSIPVACVLPHEVVHSLWSMSELQFEISMVGPRGSAGLRSYWAWALEQEWGRRHPATQGKTLDDLTTMIPLFIHIDGAE
eukprot:10032775-Alexandrium_andersonii.AAC.1